MFRLIGFIWLGVCSTNADASDAPFSLKQAIDYAIEHSPALQSARQSLRIAEYETDNAFAKFLPSLDLSSQHGLAGTAPKSQSNPWSSQLSLGLTETLYDNGESISLYRIAQLQKDQAELRLKKQRDELVLQVATSYYGFSRLKQVEQSQKEQFELLKKQYQQVEGQYRQGLKTRKDYLRLRTQLRRAETDLLSLRNDILKNRQDLLQRLGVAPASPDSDSLEFAIEVPGAPIAIDVSKINLAGHVNTRISELQNQIEEIGVDQTQRRRWPETSITSGITYGNSGYVGRGNPKFSETDQVEWNALLTLKFNLWDWGTRRRNASIAEARSQIQKNSTLTELLGVQGEIEKLKLDQKKLLEEHALNEELLELENGSYSLLRSEYEQGRVSFLDYITGLKDLTDAKSRRISSLYDLKDNFLRLRYHAGDLYESLTQN